MAFRAIVLAGALAVTGATAIGAQQADAPPADDPFTWLEEIEGERALAWARNENSAHARRPAGRSALSAIYDRALTILQARDRIPSVQFRADGLYNFWQDPDHIRGIVRRTTLASYRTEAPAVGDRARRRCARHGRGRQLGLSGHAVPAARGAALPGQPLRRRPRRQCRARVRHTHAPLRRGRLLACPTASRRRSGRTRTRCWSCGNGGRGR